MGWHRAENGVRNGPKQCRSCRAESTLLSLSLAPALSTAMVRVVGVMYSVDDSDAGLPSAAPSAVRSVSSP